MRVGRFLVEMFRDFHVAAGKDQAERVALTAEDFGDERRAAAKKRQLGGKGAIALLHARERRVGIGVGRLRHEPVGSLFAGEHAVLDEDVEQTLDEAMLRGDDAQLRDEPGVREGLTGRGGPAELAERAQNIADADTVDLGLKRIVEFEPVLVMDLGKMQTETLGCGRERERGCSRSGGGRRLLAPLDVVKALVEVGRGRGLRRARRPPRLRQRRPDRFNPVALALERIGGHGRRARAGAAIAAHSSGTPLTNSRAAD